MDKETLKKVGLYFLLIVGVVVCLIGAACIAAMPPVGIIIAAAGVGIMYPYLRWHFRERERLTGKKSPRFFTSEEPAPSAHPAPPVKSAPNKPHYEMPVISNINWNAPKAPSRIGNCLMAYRYADVNIDAPNPELYQEMKQNADYRLALKDTGEMTLEYAGRYYAKIATPKISEMLKDWVINKEPYLIFANSSDTLLVVFYRDKQARMANREHDVIKLTAYYSEAKQEAISCLEEGDELIIGEDVNSEGDDIVTVEGLGQEIGRLPKKQAQKYLDEGVAGCFVSRIEYDDEKNKYVPFVIIYW